MSKKIARIVAKKAAAAQSKIERRMDQVKGDDGYCGKTKKGSRADRNALKELRGDQ